MKFLTLNTWLLVIVIFFTHKYYGQWTDITPSFNNSSVSIDFIDTTTGFIVGPHISKTVDGGLNWSTYNFTGSLSIYNTYASLGRVRFFTASEGYAIGTDPYNNNELIFHTSDTGSNWSLLYSGYSDQIQTLIDIDVDANRIFAVGGGDVGMNQPGGIDFSLDGGTTWDTIFMNNDSYLYSVLLDPGTSNVIFGSATGIYRSTDNCNTYSLVSSGTSYDLEYINDTTIISVGDYDIQISYDNGINWNVINYSGKLLKNVEVISYDTILLAGDEDVYRTTNHGYSWERLVDLHKPNITFRGFEVFSYSLAYICGIDVTDYTHFFCGKLTSDFGNGEPYVSFTSTNTNCPNNQIFFSNQGDTTYNYSWYVDGVLASNLYDFDTLFGPNENHVVKLIGNNGTLSNQDSLIINTNGAIDLSQTHYNYSLDTLCGDANFYVQAANSILGVTYRLIHDTLILGNDYIGNGNNMYLYGNSSQLPSGSTYIVVEAFRTNNCGTTYRYDTIPVYVKPKHTPVVLTLLSDSIVCKGDTIRLQIDSTQITGYYYLKVKDTTNNGQAYTKTTFSGTGGTVNINIPTDNYWDNNQSITIFIETDYCGQNYNSYSLHLFLYNIKDKITIGSDYYTHDTLDIRNISDSSYNFTWQFNQYANLQNTTSYLPEIIYSSATQDTIHYSIANNYCVVNGDWPITVIDSMTQLNLNFCSITNVSLYTYQYVNLLFSDPSYLENMIVNNDNKTYQIYGKDIVTLDSNGVFDSIKDQDPYISYPDYKVFTSLDYLGDNIVISGNATTSNIYIGDQYFHTDVNANRPGFLVFYGQDSIKWGIYTKEPNNNAYASIMDVVVDRDDNILFSAFGTVHFPDGSTINGYGPFLVKVDTNGILLNYYNLNSIESFEAYSFNINNSGVKSLSPKIGFDCDGNILITHFQKAYGYRTDRLSKFSPGLNYLGTKDIFKRPEYNSGSSSITDNGTANDNGFITFQNNNIVRYNYFWGNSYFNGQYVNDTIFIENDTIIGFNGLNDSYNRGAILFSLDDSLSINWYKVLSNFFVTDFVPLDTTILCYGDLKGKFLSDIDSTKGRIAYSQDLFFAEINVSDGKILKAEQIGETKDLSNIRAKSKQFAGSMYKSNDGEITISYSCDSIYINDQNYDTSFYQLYFAEISLDSTCNHSVSSLSCNNPLNTIAEMDNTTPDTICVLDEVHVSVVNPLHDTLNGYLVYNSSASVLPIFANETNLNTNLYFPIPDSINGQLVKFVVQGSTINDTIGMVYVRPSSISLSPHEAILCSGDSVVFVATGGNATWSGFSGGYIDYGDSLLYSNTLGANFTANLEVNDGICDVNYTIHVEVHHPYFNNSGVPYEKCSGQPANFTINAGNLPFTNFDSIYVNGNIYQNGVPISYNADVDTSFYLFVQDSIGCVAQDTFYIPFSVNSIVFEIPDTTICLGSNPFQILVSDTTGKNGVLSGSGLIGNTFYPQNVGVGTYTITYTVSGAFICTHSKFIQITVENCSGIADFKVNAFTCYPNPVKNELIIEFLSDVNKTEISIIDINGKIVHKEIISGKKQTIDFSMFASGIYYVECNNERVKIVK